MMCFGFHSAGNNNNNNNNKKTTQDIINQSCISYVVGSRYVAASSTSEQASEQAVATGQAGW